jgi:hypothetical protein
MSVKMEAKACRPRGRRDPVLSRRYGRRYERLMLFGLYWWALADVVPDDLLSAY